MAGDAGNTEAIDDVKDASASSTRQDDTAPPETAETRTDHAPAKDESRSGSTPPARTSSASEAETGRGSRVDLEQDSEPDVAGTQEGARAEGPPRAAPPGAIPGASQLPPAPVEAIEAIAAAVARLRAEVEATSDASRRARLLYEAGEIQERGGDEAGAARDYLAAYNSDTTFREPLEGLVRLLERRRSLSNLGKLVEALVAASSTPEERARALTERALFLDAVQSDLTGARGAARDATESGAGAADSGAAWLALELIAAKLGDATLREEALRQRAEVAGDPTWRGLLLVDAARLALALGEVDDALAAAERACAEGGAARWVAHAAIERATREGPVAEDDDAARTRRRRNAEVLEAQAELVREALLDPVRGDAIGVPRRCRTVQDLADRLLRAAEVRRTAGELGAAAKDVDRALELLAEAHPRSEEEPTAAGAQSELTEAIERVALTARLRLAESIGNTALASELASRRMIAETDGGLVASLLMRVAEHAASEGDVARALGALVHATERDAMSAPPRALKLDILDAGTEPAKYAEELEDLAKHLATPDAKGRALLLASYVWATRAADAGRARRALDEAGALGVPKTAAARLGRSLASLVGDAAWYEASTKSLLDHEPGGDGALLSLEIARHRIAQGDREGAAEAIRAMQSRRDGAWLGSLLESVDIVRAPDGDGERITRTPSSAEETPETTASSGDANALEANAPGSDATGSNGFGSNGAASDGAVADGAASDGAASNARRALEEIAASIDDDDIQRGLKLACAMRAHDASDLAAAIAHLKALAEEDPSDPLVAAYLGDLLRASNERVAAADVARRLANALHVDEEFSCARFLEAGFELWRKGDRTAAYASFEAASHARPQAAEPVVAWAARGVDVDALDGRRRALDLAEESNDASIALERFALEATMGDPDDAEAALRSVHDAAHPGLRLAASLARLVWPKGAVDDGVLDEALARLAETGTSGKRAAAAERLRIARDASDAGGADVAAAARAWLDADGGAAAAMEWLAASMASGDPRHEIPARRALADLLADDARESMHASATLLDAELNPEAIFPLVPGSSHAARLANLELSPPGCDPRRRASALAELDGALGAEGELDGLALAGWSALAAGDAAAAMDVFRGVVAARHDDLQSWEGVRAAASALEDRRAYAEACEQLGQHTTNAARSAAFWEQAALAWETLDAGSDRIEPALDACFARDPSREPAFDRLFRRVRARRDADKLLAIAERRLEHTEDPTEIAKLYWEMARSLREKGDADGALVALEHVAMFDEDHVGALALSGEIFIRRGMFAEAAAKLSRLARIETAPPKNRVTAGVAAVDLYENKLARHDLALGVLLDLHAAKLTTLPVRERLARAAARTGSWQDATRILEELMMERPEREGRIEAARLALAIHRDRLRSPVGALDAATKLLEESPGDPEALDIMLGADPSLPRRRSLLERGRDALLMRLHDVPADVASHARLARLARALSDEALEQSALSCVFALSGPDGTTEQMLALVANRKRHVPQMVATPAMIRQMMAPGDDGPIAELFVVLREVLGDALGPQLATVGVNKKKDRIDPRAGTAVRTEIGAWAGTLGIPTFDLYVGGNDPMGVLGVAGETPSLVVGPSVNAPLSPIIRARVARELFALARGTTVTRWRDDTTIAAIVIAACNLSKVRIDHPPFAVLAEVERLIGNAMNRKVRAAMAPICTAFVQSGQDAKQWAARARASQARVAAVAACDASVALGDVFAEPPERLGAYCRDDARAHEVFRFVLSRQYFELRRELGLES